MAEQMSLGDILSDEKPAPAAPAPAAEAPAPDRVVEASTDGVTKPDPVEKVISRKQAARDKEQLAQGRIRDPETGQYLPKEAPKEEAKATPAPAAPVAEPPKPAAAPQQEFTEKEKAFLRAAQEERGKRQELERRMAEMQAKVPQEPAKTFWDDPEAALAKHTAEVRQEATNARLQMAEFNSRQKHPDFDEKVAVFATLLQQTPGLTQQWLASNDPAEFAYTLGKNHKELQEVGGIEAMRAKIERDTTARVRAEVEAELRAKADALAKDRAALPPSLSEARAVGGGNKPVWSGPTSLDNILGKD